MAFYTIRFDDIDTGAVADAYVSLVGLVAANTAGFRFRLTEIAIGPSEAAPVDLNVGIQILRTVSIAAGGLGTGGTAIAANAMGKLDPLSADGNITGRTGYTGEPTVFETSPLLQMGMNLRSGLFLPFAGGNRRICEKDQEMTLAVCPRTAVLRALSGHLTFEEF